MSYRIQTLRWLDSSPLRPAELQTARATCLDVSGSDQRREPLPRGLFAILYRSLQVRDIDTRHASACPYLYAFVRFSVRRDQTNAGSHARCQGSLSTVSLQISESNMRRVKGVAPFRRAACPVLISGPVSMVCLLD
jgi:hypothetical protein